MRTLVLKIANCEGRHLYFCLYIFIYIYIPLSFYFALNILLSFVGVGGWGSSDSSGG